MNEISLLDEFQVKAKINILMCRQKIFEIVNCLQAYSIQVKYLILNQQFTINISEEMEIKELIVVIFKFFYFHVKS